MNEKCDSNCSSCNKDCNDRKAPPPNFAAHLNEASSVDKVIAVISGKGGVGKSLTTSLLAAAANRRGLKTAILDADITGPSIPKAFGLKEKAQGSEDGIIPVKSKGGISIMSLNLLLEHETDPVVWRGPLIAATVKQFWTDVLWKNIDCMFVDMPPGTGDVPLTVFQSLPIDGVVISCSPQELVGMIVEKAINMASLMKIPVLGIVENMSYFKCPDCGAVHHIFGKSHIEETAAKHNIKTICRLPLDFAYASASDEGTIENVKADELLPIVELLTAKEAEQM